MKWVKQGLRFFVVTVGVIALTSFTIDATDTFRDSQSALSIFANKITEEKCPLGMVLVNSEEYNFCIDKYEASVGDDCSILKPASIQDTARNSNEANCMPVSEPDKIPWTYVAKPQAAQLCAKAGKKLPTAKEWYLSALGTPDNLQTCNLTDKLALTEKWKNCVSGTGVNDMIGNAWEFIAEETFDNKFNDRELPESGYVEQVDVNGIALKTTDKPNPVYNDDYFWTKPEGSFVIMRGGFYGSKEDGGVYTSHAQVDSNFASVATGFRCVKLLP